MLLLSILIPSLANRSKMLYELLSNLHNQIEILKVEGLVEILIDIDEGLCSVGTKRQKLLEKAKGMWVSFCDDDDEVNNEYLFSIIEAMKANTDVINFHGYMSTDGANRENFKIGKDLPYITIKDAHGNNEYLRHSNHLSVIKREIALQIGYKDLRFAEDYDYSLRLKNSGLLKTEIVIPRDLYHYRYKKNK